MKFLIFLFLISCSSTKYKDDSGFSVSAQANSPEFPVYINKVLCKDMEGIPGLCSKRLKSDEDLQISFSPRPYNYRFSLTCSKGIGKDYSIDIEKNKKYLFVITHEDFKDRLSFICIGEIFPSNRLEEVSARWELRVKVVDKNYVLRESIQMISGYLYLGDHALYSWVKDGNWWSIYTKKTRIKVKDSKNVKAYSESRRMRFNYFNM